MATKIFKEILKSSNFHDPVSEVIKKESELEGKSLGSDVSFVTKKFENAHSAGFSTSISERTAR